MAARFPINNDYEIVISPEERSLFSYSNTLSNIFRGTFSIYNSIGIRIFTTKFSSEFIIQYISSIYYIGYIAEENNCICCTIPIFENDILDYYMRICIDEYLDNISIVEVSIIEYRIETNTPITRFVFHIENEYFFEILPYNIINSFHLEIIPLNFTNIIELMEYLIEKFKLEDLKIT